MKSWICVLLIAVLWAAGCAGNQPGLPAAEGDTSAPETLLPKAGTAESEPIEYSNVTVALRRGGETMPQRALASQEEIRMVQEIVFDYMVKSAAWEGVPASRLDECILLCFDWTADQARQSFYQYDVEGRHVLQAGDEGMYSIMSDEAYQKLRTLAGLTDSGAITVEEATALLTKHFGERDAATGNSFSFGFVEQLTVDGREYYRFRISWLVDNDHMSYLTDYLVSTDGGQIKEYLP